MPVVMKRATRPGEVGDMLLKWVYSGLWHTCQMWVFCKLGDVELATRDTTEITEMLYCCMKLFVLLKFEYSDSL